VEAMKPMFAELGASEQIHQVGNQLGRNNMIETLFHPMLFVVGIILFSCQGTMQKVAT
jgi:hypothetical protein